AMETFGLLKFQYGTQSFTRQVQIFGVRPEERTKTGGFAPYLVDMRGKPLKPSFDVPEELRLEGSSAGQILLEEEKEGNKDDPLKELLRKDALAQSSDQGIIIGWAVGTLHREGRDEVIIPPGSSVRLYYPKAGMSPEAAADIFTVVGYFKSGMSENDSTHVY